MCGNLHEMLRAPTVSWTHAVIVLSHTEVLVWCVPHLRGDTPGAGVDLETGCLGSWSVPHAGGFTEYDLLLLHGRESVRKEPVRFHGQGHILGPWSLKCAERMLTV